jgi:tetratricopeptide (TPR) repeat protein
MNGKKIALGMIVRGDEPPEMIKRCLDSIAKWVDGIFVTVTTPDKGVVSVLQEYGANITYFKWVKDYSKARNFNLKSVPKEYEWYLWLDADDVFRGGDKLGEVISRAESMNAMSVFMNYLYHVEMDETNTKIKNIITQHLRERLVKNNGAYKWIAPIHETLIEQHPTTKIETDMCDVLHLSNNERFEKALKRNIEILENSLKKTKFKDPRPVYYLAKAYFDLHTPEYYKRAENLINIYLNGRVRKDGTIDRDNISGWPEERRQAWEYLALIYRERSEHNNSIKCLLNAMAEDPEFPSTYTQLAASYMMKEEFERALFWLRMATHVSPKKSTLISNPKDEIMTGLQVAYQAFLHTNDIDKAWESARGLIELDEKNEVFRKYFMFIDELKRQRDTTKNIVDLVNYLRLTGEHDKVKQLVRAIPNLIADNPFMVELVRQETPPKKWEDNEVAIYCGPGFTPWGPSRLADPKDGFVGGSEEAVILLSKSLAKLGWKVTVYADPAEDEGEHDGVTYLPYFHFNKMDEFNIIIRWRDITFFDQKITAKKKFVWCHDILNPLDYTKERVDGVDRIFPLSKWHRDNIKDVPDEKIMITSNGIEV